MLDALRNRCDNRQKWEQPGLSWSLAGVPTGITDYLGGLICPEWVFSVSESREVINIRQASQYLGVSPDTLYRYITEGEIPAFKLGNRWKFRKTILDRWMERKMSQGHGKKR